MELVRYLCPHCRSRVLTYVKDRKYFCAKCNEIGDQTDLIRSVEPDYWDSLPEPEESE